MTEDISTITQPLKEEMISWCLSTLWLVLSPDYKERDIPPTALSFLSMLSGQLQREKTIIIQSSAFAHFVECQRAISTEVKVFASPTDDVRLCAISSLSTPGQPKVAHWVRFVRPGTE